jgi:hypothetical protein
MIPVSLYAAMKVEIDMLFSVKCGVSHAPITKPMLHGIPNDVKNNNFCDYSHSM